MSDVIHYFAYGSNMNPARVQKRDMLFEDYQSGVLHDFALTFNKRSVKYPGAASANVTRTDAARTEGVVYRLAHPEQILKMDPFEGYPHRYVREAHPIYCGDEAVTAWVYIATREYITEGLKPARWYLDHLLAGKEHLSADYYSALLQVDCLPDSTQEPE